MQMVVGAGIRPAHGMLMRAHLLEQQARDESVDTEPPGAAASRFVWSCKVGAAVAFLVGTGGLLTPDYVAARDERGYRLQDFGYPASTPSDSAKLRVRNSTENLARIRAVFKPTVTELASLLGVSRQAIYNWQAGQPIAEQNDSRLEQLARAADLLSEEGLAANPSVMRRKLAGGSTLFESVRAGHAADAAALSLIAMVKRELAQRQLVAERLANRARKPVDAGDIGAPRFDERG